MCPIEEVGGKTNQGLESPSSRFPSEFKSPLGEPLCKRATATDQGNPQTEEIGEKGVAEGKPKELVKSIHSFITIA